MEEGRLARAAHFFARQLDDRSAELRAELDAWLGADPRNAIAFARAGAAWERAAGVGAMAPSPVQDENRRDMAGASQQGQDQQ
ncbi:DUF4880 domain-containing protein [Rhizorhabdus dicambivorans]|uniref:DUF4880 domain-containing protein n=1 Tax=Rhizorhabdus dicambivorans TaxID=1850238 RepID=A0A2A4G2Q8_9SPHN|nr:DUF4880 domain-containing protein [Rhizorhabdus dicambivorans]PCE44090.1 DUF4880 domain-containing protein [Rhizorhabdus dicambivorans]